MGFENSYGDDERASSYARLEFAGTYYLAYRDLPAIIRKHVVGSHAVDFGCGTGRSTRFLRGLGFEAVGIDISEPMVRMARSLDPGGDYRVITDGDWAGLGRGRFDLALSAFTFDNIADAEKRVALLRGLRQLLAVDGKVMLLDSKPELYGRDWVSFTTSIFPENRSPKSGDIVKTIIEGIGDGRPVEDIYWSDADYRRMFADAELDIVDVHRPLATACEPYPWINEMTVAPWVIYVLASRPGSEP